MLEKLKVEIKNEQMRKMREDRHGAVEHHPVLLNPRVPRDG